MWSKIPNLLAITGETLTIATGAALPRRAPRLSDQTEQRGCGGRRERDDHERRPAPDQERRDEQRRRARVEHEPVTGAEALHGDQRRQDRTTTSSSGQRSDRRGQAAPPTTSPTAFSPYAPAHSAITGHQLIVRAASGRGVGRTRNGTATTPPR